MPDISSIAAICSTGIVAYKTYKAGVNALTHQVAMDNAKYNIRASAIMPGGADEYADGHRGDLEVARNF